MPKGFDPRLNDPSNYEGYLPPDWEERVAFIVRRDDYTCVNCDTKQEFDALRVVHELPLEAGGTNHLSNLLTLCQPCSADFTAPTHSSESADDNRVLEKQSDVPTIDSADNAADTNGDRQRVPDIVSGEFLKADSQSTSEADGVGGREERSQPKSGTQPSSRIPKWKGQPTADDSLTRPDTPEGSPADKRRRRRKRQRKQDAAEDDPTDYSLFGRSILALAVGTTMFVTYLFIIIAFILLTPEIWTSLATLVLPLGGAILGTRYPLSTVVAVGYLAGLVGILLAFVPLPTDGTLSTIVFFEPIVAPLIGVAYGILADYYEFSLLDQVSRPQSLDW